MSETRGNMPVSTYRDRFGEPFTTDEVYGYWLFVAGAVVAIVGTAVFLTSMGAGRTGTRGVAYLLSGVGLATALSGLVVGQSFHRTAKLLVYLGFLVCLAAMTWFLTVFPGQWALGSASAQGVVAVYTLGLALVTLSGAIAPISVGQSRARRAVEKRLADARSDGVADDRRIEELEATVDERDDRIEELESELAESRADAERAATEAEVAAEAAREETASVRDDLHAAASHVNALSKSSATFDVYRDKSGQWRWRLVHRNGNVLGDSGEEYASRSNARRAADRVQEAAGDAAVDADSGVRFETIEDAGGEFRWRLVAANGETIADSGEGYSSRSGLEEAIDRVREYAPEADRLTMATAAVEVYEDAGGEFRWRLRHRNGTILGTSGEGYTGRSKALNVINGVKRHAPNAPVGEEGEGDGAEADDGEPAGKGT